jgi:hypothetical protein
MKVRYIAEWNTPHSWVPVGAVVEMTAAAAKPLIDGGIVAVVDEPKPEPKPEPVVAPKPSVKRGK